MTEALIGPNAIIQVADAIVREFGRDHLSQIMHTAGIGHFMTDPPRHMVNELDVVRLHRAVASRLSLEEARLVMWQAGENTARYLLANRIPRLAQIMLKSLPAGLAARLLLVAISKHAWTFAGSSTFSYTLPAPVRISLEGSPLFAAPASQSLAEAYFEATFQTLFRALVSPRTRIITSGRASSATRQDAHSADAVCAFDLDWRS